MVKGNGQALYLALGVFDLPGKLGTLGDQCGYDVRKRFAVAVVKGDKFVAHGRIDGAIPANRL